LLAGIDVLQPDDVVEASRLLQRYGESASVYAGGCELLLLLRQRLTNRDYLIDVKRIPALGGLAWEGDRLRIGATVTHRAIERSRDVVEHFPLLAEVERQVANVRIRNVGTLGGNLAFGLPQSDPGTLLLLGDTEVRLGSARGERTLALDDFLVGAYRTALEPDELLLDVRVKPLSSDWRTYYHRFARLERPMVGVAVGVKMVDGAIGEARVAVGGVVARPTRLTFLEERFQGAAPADVPGILAEHRSQLKSVLEPISDLHGSADYKLHMTRVFIGRAIQRAAAGGTDVR
jgi:carbon-monoxide dehydrogenase medium subunit